MAIKPLNSVAGFSVGETPNVVIYGNGDITTTNLAVAGEANLGPIGNVVISGGTSGQVIQTDGSGTLSFVTIDTWRIQNGTSNVQIASSGGPVTITVAGNANIATFTSTGLDINGYVTVQGNVTANGNISANNYLVTPATKDLIIAPATNLIRTDANVNPYNDNTYNLGNNLARWANIYSSEANVSGNANVGTLRTDNLLHANGTSWDFATASGSNTWVQFSDGTDLASSANLTFNDATQVLAVIGNITATDTANVGNLRTDNLLYANGQPWDLQEAAGSGTQIQYNDGSNNFGASANFTYNDATQAFYVNGTVSSTGSATVGNLSTSGTISSTGTATVGNVSTTGTISSTGTATVGNVSTTGTISSTGTATVGNLSVTNNVTSSLIPDATNAYDLGNSTSTWGNIYAANFVGNISGNLAAPGANTDIIFNDSGVANAVANFTYNKTFNSGGGQLNVGNTHGGEIITDTFYSGYANVNGNVDTSGNVNVTGNISGTDITASGNISTTGAGGDITMTGGDLTGVNNISANTANYSSNVTVNNLTVNLEISGNTANFTGNITALNANLGNLVTANYINAAVDIHALAGNVNANGNVSANGFLNSANANVTGEVLAGSVKTATIVATTGNITISASGSNENVILSPSGTGTVDTGLHRITNVGTPVEPNDAVTKEYADSIGQGLFIHTPVTVEANVALNGTYAQGGTTQTTTTIAGGKTITFGANHGLSVNDGIVWTNSFNGIVGGEAYWVQTVPALNQITIRDGYFGAEVTTLTNGTGLTQASRANPGVGATLTNAGANAALVIDSVSVANGDRVLVYTQTSTYENGVYDVTDKGNASAAWVLTRSSDMNKYIPKSTVGLGSGSYFFITEGANAAGESYVMTLPEGEVIIGTDGITFTQFQAAGSYTAGNGIAINGTVISANVDLVTTDIVGGNIVVKASANLTTPNIGDATFSSITWDTINGNGNVTANNLSISNLANITGDFTVAGNSTFGNLVTINNGLQACVGNINGSNAAFSANVTVNELTVNNNISGNTANFTGNISSLNANLGNLVTANFFTGTQVNGTSNVAIPTTNGNVEITSGGNLTLTVTDVGANIVGNLNVTGNFSVGALESSNVKADIAVFVGNTTVTWATTTTVSVTANQTIASYNLTGTDITAVEWIVKGVDSGGRNSVATVLCVTDGSSVDYTTYGTVQLGGYTGSLAVNVVGSTIRLQVTPASSNSTVWTTQYRLI